MITLLLLLLSFYILVWTFKLCMLPISLMFKLVFGFGKKSGFGLFHSIIFAMRMLSKS